MTSQQQAFFSATAVVLLVGVVGFARPAHAQTEIMNNFRYSSGQDIQPIFEGWSRNPDGTFNLHFGYLNRNWVQELTIPTGPNNSVEPGGPDRGQPTFFMTRTQRNLFMVVVPKDWGRKEVTWTIVANGKTQKAFGWLQPEWEIDPAGGAATGGQTGPGLQGNKPPTITIEAGSSVMLGRSLSLNSTVVDDGIPKPAGPRKPAVGQETPPALQTKMDAPVNVPQIAPSRGQANAAGGGGGGVRGPSVTWMVWRGPANANFAARNIPVKDGRADTTVTFTVPGDYVLRARASDRILFTDKEIKVTVTGAGAQQ